jgi:8-oxo-dGTP diphosphatase
MQTITIKSVAGVIFSPDRKEVLLVKRRDVPVWVLPGGGIETQESSVDAVIREILEETGFTVKIDRLVGLYIPINSLTKPTHLYECTILEGAIKTSAETSSIQFFPLTGLPKLLPPPFRGWIEDAYKKQPFIHKKISDVNYRTLIINLAKHPVLVIRFILARLGIAINL